MRGILTLAILYLLTIVTFANASMRGSGTVPYTLDTTNNNISIGGPLNSITTGSQNICLGNSTCSGITTGTNNTIIVNGESRLTTGQNNIIIGPLGDVVLLDTSYAIGIGVMTKPGSNDVAIGNLALSATVTNGQGNVAIGSVALSLLTSGISNVAVGQSAGVFMHAGSSNTLMGAQAGANITSGSNNVALGRWVGGTTLTIGSNNILIGTTSAIDVTTSSTSNTINFGNIWTVTGTDTASTSNGTIAGNLNVVGTLQQNGVNVSAAGSGAEQTVSFQPGLITAVTNTKGVFGKFVKTSTVDNIVGSAVTFTCAGNPTITMYECGTTAACNSSPVTIGSVTVTAGGTATDGTINSATITAGDYVAFAISAGTCTALDIAATAQVHAN